MGEAGEHEGREGLEAFCETVVGGWLDRHRTMTVSELADRIERRIIGMELPLRREVRRFIRRLTTPGGLLLHGHSIGRFSRLPLHRREQVIRGLLVSETGRWCGIARSLHRQVCFAATGFRPGNENDVPLSASGRDGTEADPDAVGGNPAFHVATVRPGQSTLACDWLVIGSGPAGSVMAAELAETGQSVLLVDQGELLEPGRRMGDGQTSRHLSETFAGWSAAPEPVVTTAGRTFGGGSVVNWGTCLDPPEHVLKEWHNVTGYSFPASEIFRHSLFAVRRRLFLQPAPLDDPHSRRMLAAAGELGLSLKATETNTAGCDQCAGCQFGCSTGMKKDMRTTWLVDAARLGVYLLPGCRIERLEVQNGTAKFAVGQLQDGGLDARPVEISFRQCVLAAGAIQTPAILQRSGYSNPHLGHHLCLHPAVIVPAVFPEAWRRSGPVQPWVCDDLELRTGTSAGLILENASFTPGLAAMVLPWRGRDEFAAMLASLDHWSGTLVMARDAGTGSVSVDDKSRPCIRYRLGDRQRAGLERGSGLASQLLQTAGAMVVYDPVWDFRAQVGGAAPDRKKNLGGLERATRGSLKLWSAHQFGTCRMADSPQRGTVTPHGQVYGLTNVLVCDSSVFPTAPGVNPMVSVCTMSHFLAQQIKERFC